LWSKMFPYGLSFPFNLGSITSSPYFVVFVIIVVPLLGFALYLRFFLRGGRPTSREGAGVQAGGVGGEAQPQVQAQPQPQPQERGEDLVKAVGQLGSKVDRVEANLSKAVAAGFGDVMGELKNLSQKLEDAVLAIKAAQSDAASPFNAGVDDSGRPKNGEPSGVGAAVGAPNLDVGGAFSRELGDSDVGSLLEACALLEILGYNRRQVELLFEVGLLDVKHLELIGRIEQVLEKYGSELKARDIALIVFKTSPPQSAFQEKARRVLRVLHEMGEGDAGGSSE